MDDVEIVAVIVSYRSAALVIDCLTSIHSERESPNLNINVVIVDNASGDLPQIEEAVRRNGWSKWVTLVLAPMNGGFSYGNNLGIRRAYELGKPHFIYLLNPDTQVRPGAVGALIDYLKRHRQVGIAGGSFETEEGKLWPFAFRFPSIFSEIDAGLQLGLVTRLLSGWTVPRAMGNFSQQADWISGASMMIRPEVFAAIGGLDENFFLYFEETEFCRRALRAGFSTWYVPESRVMHIVGRSTGYDDKTRLSQRLPGYWFDSRVRYFALTYGVDRAALIDVVAIVAAFFGLLKRKVLRRPGTPHFIRDLWAHSILRPKNRFIPALKTYFPPV